MGLIGREIHRIEAVNMQFKLFITFVCKSYNKLVPLDSCLMNVGHYTKPLKLSCLLSSFIFFSITISTLCKQLEDYSMHLR